MKLHIITIFPEAFDSYLSTSIAKNAVNKGLLDIKLYKLNNFSYDNLKRVDDKVYGSHGQLIKADILSRAIEYIFSKIGKKIKVVYMSPKGDLLNQEKIEKYSNELNDEFIIICGHYEGIDQRIIDLYGVSEISIGEYILTSGELARQVFIDSLVRLVPGVINSEISHEEESFSVKLNRQKEYPQYTGPKEFSGLSVPDVLTSGNHKAIDDWKIKNLS
ncbi:MAG: tRNA (guanosine(37)-N1)-methyltransferase TrmD [Candidatus Gracilibacteria bacterium]|nr:tRNA (guanosine(37)-N1)-methyltransferase TrmD [Candidatus Gracilibacteria bacterium]